MKKDKSLKVKRIEEIEYIYNLLQRTLEKEGYELPQFTHADRGYKSFPIELKNEIIYCKMPTYERPPRRA